MLFFCFGVTQTRNRKCAKPFCFLILVSCFLTLVCGGPKNLGWASVSVYARVYGYICACAWLDAF